MKIGEDGKLYSWGSNEYGQLGIGSTSSKSQPTLLTLPNEELPVSVFTGFFHSIVITNKNNVYVWGRNECGQLGIGNTTNQTTPQLLTLPNGEKPISVYMGHSHSIVITDKDNYYTWGRNDYGQLGIGNKINQLTPQLLNLSIEGKPTSISLGFISSMVLTDKGEICVWGSNSWGQLGLGNVGDQLTPKKLTLPNGEKPISVHIKDIHSMALTESGNLYAWGYNGYGQLGFGNKSSQNVPKKVSFALDSKIKSVVLGTYYSTVFMEDGSIYAWGYNQSGQLGIGNNVEQLTPQKVKLPENEKFNSILIGCYSSIATTDKGDIYTWGKNDKGQLGLGNKTHKLTPIKVELP